MRTRIGSLAAAALLAASLIVGTAGTALMAQLAPVTASTPLITVNAGTTTMPWVNLTSFANQGYNGLCFGVDTSQVPVADTLQVILQFSGDGGHTTMSAYDYPITTSGGPHVNRLGVESPVGICEALPPSGPSGIEARAIVTVPEQVKVTFSAQLYQQLN